MLTLLLEDLIILTYNHFRSKGDYRLACMRSISILRDASHRTRATLRREIHAWRLQGRLPRGVHSATGREWLGLPAVRPPQAFHQRVQQQVNRQPSDTSIERESISSRSRSGQRGYRLRRVESALRVLPECGRSELLPRPDRHLKPQRTTRHLPGRPSGAGSDASAK